MDLMKSSFETDEYEYYHKKFDGRKRLRSQSSSTSENNNNFEPFIKRRKHQDSEGNDSGISDNSTSPPPTSFFGVEKLPSSFATQIKQLDRKKADRLCKYHGNMVRKFAPKQRAPKDQERRDKNTIACRFSRYSKKIQHAVMEQKYQDYSQLYQHVMLEAVSVSFYFHHLLNLAEDKKRKSFTIAYLLSDK